MRTILKHAADRGLAATGTVFGSPVPTDTDAFAKALGLSGRVQLKKSGYPSSFVLAAAKPWTDVSEGFDFGGLAGQVPAVPNVVLWDPWLDDMLHKLAGKPGGPKQLEASAQQVLAGDGFWNLVTRLRQGRELLITSDHGYAVSYRFIDLPQSLGEAFREHFGAKRFGTIPSASLAPAGGAPMYVTVADRTSIVGPWKWKSPGGYPHLNHGGLTLGEACVPFITFEALS